MLEMEGMVHQQDQMRAELEGRQRRLVTLQSEAAAARQRLQTVGAAVQGHVEERLRRSREAAVVAAAPQLRTIVAESCAAALAEVRPTTRHPRCSHLRSVARGTEGYGWQVAAAETQQREAQAARAREKADGTKAEAVF